MREKEYEKLEIEVIAFDMDDVRMSQSIFSKASGESKGILGNNILKGFWDEEK